MNSFAQPFNAVVNGATRGIGLAFVHALLPVPSLERLFAKSRHAASDEKLAELASGGDHRLRAFDIDVTVEASVAAAAAAVQAEAARVDLFVNCAGLLHDGTSVQPEKRLADVAPASLERSFAVNAIGPLLIARHFQGLLPRQDRVIVASLSARVGSIADNRLGGWYAYRASKAAQNMITRNLSMELRRRARGIICVALHPGTVDTGLSRPFQGNVPEGRLFTPERVDALLNLAGYQMTIMGSTRTLGYSSSDRRPKPYPPKPQLLEAVW